MLKQVRAALSEDRSRLLVLLSAMGAALVAGTLPELIKIIPGSNWTMASIFVVGLAIIAVTWISLNARSGVGVAIFLPPTTTSNWSDRELLHTASQARRQHVNFFYLNINDLQGELDDQFRVGLAQRVLEARLNEERSHKSSHISFYLSSSLADAYMLGQQTFRSNDPARLHVTQFASISVNQVSRGWNASKPPAINLTGTSTGPAATSDGGEVSTYLSEDIITFPGVPPEATHRTALIVCLIASDTMVGEAKIAASGQQQSTSRKYEVTANDVCGRALIFRLSVPQVPTDSEMYNLIMRRISEKWSLFVQMQTNTHSNTQSERLFIASPVSIAFALGALLPQSTKAVKYTN
ncbi:hypothetical protein HQO44_20840 [Rhodococcus fascians]|nr:hypothetical protein [Rhodococcus fascians]